MRKGSRFNRCLGDTNFGCHFIIIRNSRKSNQLHFSKIVVCIEASLFGFECTLLESISNTSRNMKGEESGVKLVSAVMTELYINIYNFRLENGEFYENCK